MAQQTTVDWLREQYVYITWMVNRGELPIDASFELILKRFDQANKMFEKQIIDAHNNGKFVLPPNENGEQYYNETYGK